MPKLPLASSKRYQANGAGSDVTFTVEEPLIAPAVAVTVVDALQTTGGIKTGRSVDGTEIAVGSGPSEARLARQRRAELVVGRGRKLFLAVGSDRCAAGADNNAVRHLVQREIHGAGRREPELIGDRNDKRVVAGLGERGDGVLAGILPIAAERRPGPAGCRWWPRCR